MLKKELYKKHKVLILSACCLIFILSVVGVFSIYQYRINEISNSLLIDGIEKNTNIQKNHAEIILDDLKEILNLLDDTHSTIPENGWNLEFQNGHVHVDYYTSEQAYESLNNDECYQQLLEGKEVTNDIDDSLLKDDLSFSLLHPILADENLIGILCAHIDAELLIKDAKETVSLFQKTYTILTKADGSIVYADTPYPNNKNLFASALQGGIDSDEIESIHQLFMKDTSETVNFRGKGNDYFMSWEALSFNDWRIVRFARSPDVILHTKTILRGMIITGLCLIALTAIFCTVLIKILLRQKHRLETQQRRYDALSQFNDTMLFEYDVISNQMKFTPNAFERLDLDHEHMEGFSGEYYMQHLLHPDDQENIQKNFQPSSIELGQTYYLEARLRCRDGKYYWFGCQYKSIENCNKGPCQIIGKLVDINDQHGREQTLKEAALIDALTGVYNRAAEDIINEKLKNNPQGLFFMLDLDDFKSINDSHGHATGDDLLINVAKILREVFRPNDIIARIGGDEFIAFISGISDPNVAKKKADAIQDRMEQLQIPGNEQFISASIGASIAPQNGTTYDELTRAADHAMYSIKKHSKKGFAIHQNND